jgi:hypothetical protein
LAGSLLNIGVIDEQDAEEMKYALAIGLAKSAYKLGTNVKLTEEDL